MKRKQNVLFVLFWSLTLVSLATAEEPYSIAWTSQFGTNDTDYSNSVAIDFAGNTYITGNTRGSLEGDNIGDYDAFLTKYDPAGNQLWTKQLGTDGYDYSKSVTTDSSGNVFITGYTQGSLGGTNQGYHDAYIAKCDSNGNILWSNQLGTSNKDVSSSIAVDNSGNAYITGWINQTNLINSPDAFLAKYNTSGNLVWMQEISTGRGEYSSCIAVDSFGNPYITGITQGSLSAPNAGDRDAFLSKYDTNGNQIWSKQLGTPYLDTGASIAIDAYGSIYLAGITDGTLGEIDYNSRDLYVAKFDLSGNQLWIEQIGSTKQEGSVSIAVDNMGNAIIAGHTLGDLGGINAGNYDTYLAKTDSAGNLLWTEQFGTSSHDLGYSVALDNYGNVLITGSTMGDLYDSNMGDYDVFLVKYSVPEPATLSLLALGGLALLRKRK